MFIYVPKRHLIYTFIFRVLKWYKYIIYFYIIHPLSHFLLHFLHFHCLTTTFSWWHCNHLWDITDNWWSLKQGKSIYSWIWCHKANYITVQVSIGMQIEATQLNAGHCEKRRGSLYLHFKLGICIMELYWKFQKEPWGLKQPWLCPHFPLLMPIISQHQEIVWSN